MTDRLLADLALARGPLRDDGGLRRASDWWSLVQARDGLVLDVAGEKLAVAGGELAWRAPRAEDEGRAVLLGVASVPRVVVLHDADALSPENGTPAAEASGNSSTVARLREVGAALSDTDAALATTAVALAQWHARQGRCPQCGGATQISEAGWSRRCPTCSATHFPRTDPAIIVLVRDREDRALLGQRADWHRSWFSTLAGFVEAGESAEHTLRREVFEEAGVVVDPDTLRYRGSQPWPFPGSLMLGFHAWAADDRDPTADGEEISVARWFSREELADLATAGQVRIPPRVSIARHLIEDWFGGPLPGDWSRP